MIPANRSIGESYLRTAFGETATFRAGQWEAIETLLEPGSRLLLVQPPGWGKSAVYLVASRFLQDARRGLTLVVSPLVALMRNQVQMAAKMGIEAVNLDSQFDGDHAALAERIHKHDVHLLYVAPERLASKAFNSELWPVIQSELELLVVDEAHCISEWGHSFRPDYLRLLPIIENLRAECGVMATTGSAPARIMADLDAMLGGNPTTIRGLRKGPRIQQNAFEFRSHPERLAFLGQAISKLPKPGIIFALTIASAEQIAGYLRSCGMRVSAYHAGLDAETRCELELALDNNDLDALVATSALGMGYDKQDLHFVIHAQPPLSMVAYDQQLGRAGRDGSQAYGAILWTNEDIEMGDLILKREEPNPKLVAQVYDRIASGATWRELAQLGSFADLEFALGLLTATNAVTASGEGFVTGEGTSKPIFDELIRHSDYRASRWLELQLFLVTKACRLQALFKSLGENPIGRCGQCDNCRPRKRMSIASNELVRAKSYLAGLLYVIEPKTKLIAFPGLYRETKLSEGELALQGIALTSYADVVIGRRVRDAKYRNAKIPPELLERAQLALQRVNFKPDWVTWIPSERHDLIPRWAQELATALGVPARESLVRVDQRPPQKLMHSQVKQFVNVWGAWEVNEPMKGKALLIDDVVDSGWTFTVAALLLRQAGAQAVMPLAWASGARGRLKVLEDA